MEKKIEIPFSKTKLILGLIVVSCCIILFVAIIVLMPELRTVGRGILIVGILISLIGIIAIIKKMFDKKPAIIIGADGIIDNTKKYSLGVIEWEDISQINLIRVGVLKILLIHVHSNEKYLERINKNKTIHKALDPREDYKVYGTPFAILSSVIKISLTDLETLLNAELKKNRKYQL